MVVNSREIVNAITLENDKKLEEPQKIPTSYIFEEETIEKGKTIIPKNKMWHQ